MFKPARGWSWEGSAKAELFKKASTPWGSDESKGPGPNVLVGVDVEVEVEVDDEEEAAGEAGCCEDDEDLRPVRASQIDMVERIKKN